MEFRLSEVCKVLGKNAQMVDFSILADPAVCRVPDWTDVSRSLVTAVGVKRMCEHEGRGQDTHEVLRSLVFGKKSQGVTRKSTVSRERLGLCAKTEAIHRFLAENVDEYDLARAFRELPEIMALFSSAAAMNAARTE